MPSEILRYTPPMTLHWHDVVPHFFNPGIENQFLLFFCRSTCERRTFTITLSVYQGIRAREFLPKLRRLKVLRIAFWGHFIASAVRPSALKAFILLRLTPRIARWVKLLSALLARDAKDPQRLDFPPVMLDPCSVSSLMDRPSAWPAR